MRREGDSDGEVVEVTYSPGLEGIVAARTELCDINGKTGKLLYRGYDIPDLAAQSTFEEVAYLLWYGRLPARDELDRFTAELAAERPVPADVIGLLRQLPRNATPMDLLRTGISALGLYDVDATDNSPEANQRKARRLTAQGATLVAAIGRLTQGLEPVAPDPRHNLATDFLRMLQDQVPDPELARAFDVCLILHADHGLNASTFAARVVASTLSDMHSAMTAAVCALKGPLHGGANEAVMNMLREIGDPARANEWVQRALAEKRRIMGFGHRVYKTEDPRATVLRRISESLGKRFNQTQWYDMSRTIELVITADKGLYPNVDFYSASVYHLMGIETTLFTPIFAVSRMSGWTAHVLEQLSGNRIMRPESEYIGEADRAYVPLDLRLPSTVG
ncbi:MAG: citrate/2-methylcitrate synthase [Candidatus Dormibacteria bacterium]